MTGSIVLSKQNPVHKYKQKNSNPEKVMYGVPQGLVLGLLLSIHYLHK